MNAGARRPIARRSIADWVAGLSAGMLALLLLLRVLRYAWVTLPGEADLQLGNALIFAWMLFILPLLLLPRHLVLLGLLLLALALRPRLGFVRVEGRLLLRPWLHALLWVECALNHYLFDLNPHLAVLTAGGLLCVEIDRARAGERPGDRRLALAGIGLLILWAVWSYTLADAVAGLVFAAVVWLALRGAKRVTGSRERRLAVLLAGAGCQLLAALLPLLVPLHGGTELGPGLAYSFCESPEHDKLFAAVPEAPTMLPWSLGSAHGAGGYVAEYELPSMTNEKRHRFFSGDFHGRLEWLTCTRDRVYVGMTNTTWRGRSRQDHAMAFDIADPRHFEPDVMDGLPVGHGMVHDTRRDVLYFVSENKPAIGRLDLHSGARGPALAGVPQQKTVLSLVAGPSSYQAERDSMFLVEWFGGTHAYEIDLESGLRRRLFPHRDGGALGLLVDPKYGRLYVVGVWGMEVFDIDTGEVVARRRLGLLSRSPVIDPVAGLVYVASTSEGRIRVFDRESLELRGMIAIGYGPRIPYFSRDTGRLLASSSLAHYWWDGAALAERFRAR